MEWSSGVERASVVERASGVEQESGVERASCPFPPTTYPTPNAKGEQHF